jgi:nitroreductase
VTDATLDLLRTRRSVAARDLVEPGPDEAQLEKLLEAGLRVPDHGKLGPWRIQIVDKKGQAALGDLYARLFAENYPDPRPEQIELERKRPQQAPLLLIVWSVRQAGHKIPEFEQILSAGAVCQNLLLAAHAMGFAANWLTGWPAYDTQVKAALGHARDDIAGFIFVGTPTGKPEDRPRKSVAQVSERWSGPVEI